MKSNTFRRCVGVIVLGGMMSLPAAMAQVVVHLADPAEATNPDAKPVDTVQKEIDLRKELGLPAPKARTAREFNGDMRNAPKGTISGSIITEDGSPVPDRINLQVMVQWGDGGGSGTGFAVSNGSFSQEVMAGTLYLYAQTPGWSGSVLGPIELEADKSVDDLSIVLTHGRSIQVIVLDSQKHPIAGAQVNGNSRLGNYFSGNASAVTDDQGVATLKDLPSSARFTQVSVTAKGYQPYYTQVESASEDPVTIALGRVQPIVLNVTELETGKPIKNARIYQEDPRMMSMYNRVMEPMGTSDDTGRLELIPPDGRNEFNGYILTPDDRFDVVYLPQGKLSGEVILDQPITITGRVVGDLKKLQRSNRGVGPVLQLRNQYVRAQYGGMYSSELQVPVTEKDGHNEFVISAVMPGTITIQKPGGGQITFNVEKSEKDLVIDLDSANLTTHPAPVPTTNPAATPASVPGAAPVIRGGSSSALPVAPDLSRFVDSLPVSMVMPLVTQISEVGEQVAAPDTRPASMERDRRALLGNAKDVGGGAAADKPAEATKSVVVEFKPPTGVEKIQGFVGVRSYPRGGGRQMPMQWQEVKDNKVSFDLPERGSAQFDMTQLPGLMVRLEQVEIGNPDPNANRNERYDQAVISRDASGTTTIRLHPAPAGMVRCKLTDETGTPIAGVRPQIMMAPGQNSPRGWQGNVTSIEVPEEPGTYLITDVPIGSSVMVYVNGEGMGSPLSRAVSNPLTLTPANPLADVEIAVPRGQDYTVQVVDDQGEPLAGFPVEIGIRDTNFGGGGSFITDGLGQFVARNVNLEGDAKLYANAGGRGGWQATQILFEKDQTTAKIQLHRGLTFKGTLLDEATQRPIIGARLYAESQNVRGRSSFYTNSAAVTNLRGEFEFDSFAPGDFNLRCDYIRIRQDSGIYAVGNQEQRVTIYGRMEEGRGDMKFRLGKLPAEIKAAAEKAVAEKASAGAATDGLATGTDTDPAAADQDAVAKAEAEKAAAMEKVAAENAARENAAPPEPAPPVLIR